MQDLVQLSLEDEDVAELFEGVTAGAKIKLTLEVTVSEIDDERLVATLDEVHDDVDILDDENEDDDEEDYEEDDDGDEEEEEDSEYTEA